MVLEKTSLQQIKNKKIIKKLITQTKHLKNYVFTEINLKTKINLYKNSWLTKKVTSLKANSIQTICSTRLQTSVLTTN